MAQHPTNCEICARLEQIEREEHPGFIAHLPMGAFVLGDSQQWRGYALLLCRLPVADLEDLAWQTRLEFLRDVALCSEAVSNVLRPHKMNVESLGNVVPHLHFHFFPRLQGESFPLQPIWLQQNDDTPFDPARDGPLIEKLRREIENLMRERI